MFSKVKKFVTSLEKCKLFKMKEDKLRAKLIKLNCALSAVGVLTVEAKDDLDFNRLADIETRIEELQLKVKEMIYLNEISN